MHIQLDQRSQDFRDGVAYAAHILLHAVQASHGHSGYIPPDSGLKPCCAGEVINFAVGMADGLVAAAGVDVEEHDHQLAAVTAETPETKA